MEIVKLPVRRNDRSLDTSGNHKRTDELGTFPHQGRHNDLAAEFAHAETVECGGGKYAPSEESKEVS